jgi:hypothetical protein
MAHSSTHVPEQSGKRAGNGLPARGTSWLVAALIVALAILAAWAFLKTSHRGPGDLPDPGERIMPRTMTPDNAP